jgi:hypothetical protein
MKRGVLFGLAGVLVVALVVGLGAAAPARAEVVSKVDQCNPTGRQICITLRTFQNITASDSTRATDGNRYTWVEWSLKNRGTSTLTNVAATVRFCDAGTSLTDPLHPCASSAALVAPPAGCTAPNATTLVCTYPNLAAGASTAPQSTYFRTAYAPVPSTDITVTASAKEGPNDAKSCDPLTDANCDTWPVTITNSYEPELDAAYTFAINGNKFHLQTDDALSSFDFTAAQGIFFTTFKTLPFSSDPATNYCFSSVPCFDRTLFANTDNGSSGPVAFYARLLTPPTGVTANNVTAIHTYDAMTFTAASNRLTAPAGAPQFWRTVKGVTTCAMDGLWLQSDVFGPTAAKYYVVGCATDNSFRLAATQGGAPLTLTNATGSANPIRIIGDQSDERSSAGCTTTTPPANIPSVCGAKVKGNNQAIDAWLWDSANGYGQF